jgi:hypothetical protein
VAQFTTPPDAYEMHFVLSGTRAADGSGERKWDNNGGSNFYCRLGPELDTVVASKQLLLPRAESHAAADGGDGSESTRAGHGGALVADKKHSLALAQARAALAAPLQPIASKNINR